MRDGPTYRLIDALLKEGHPLMIAAARQIAQMRKERDELNQKIHNQRVALRENWEITEMRAEYARCWYPSKLLTSILQRSLKH